MILREVEKNDLEKIAALYKACYNITMNPVSYNYWHLRNGKYGSLLCEVDGEVVGHNAFVERTYYCNNIPIKVAVSIAGMVSPLYKKPGLFLKMLDYSISNYKGDCVIAFPNKNAEPFWCRILKFNTNRENYFYITPEKLNLEFNEELIFKIERPEELINLRTKVHPRYSYQEHIIDDFKMITKEYNNNIELVYINKISPKLITGLKNIFNMGYKRINTINIYKEILEKAGFILGDNKVFVYKWLNEKFTGIPFECQMIDSDVF